MVIPLDKPVVCPLLVGREEQVAALAHALEETRDGGGRALLVTGEAGIGKSRIAAEARALAEARGFLVLQGQCFEPDRMLPYAPVHDLLRAWLAASPAVAAEAIEPVAADLVALLPELAGRLPDSAPPAVVDPAQENHRRFHALTDLVLELAGSRPLLLVVEDAHWCDETSLDWLLFLARRIRDRPLALLLTYRDDEMPDELAHAVAELDRMRLGAEVRVTPLSRGEVGAMVRAVFGIDRRALFDPPELARADVAELLHDLTEGNPFFVEEVLRALIASGEIRRVDGGWDAAPLGDLRVRLPRSIGDAVRRRSAGLGEEARRTLTVAAVAGRRVELDFLADLRGIGASDLLAHVKELVAAGLLVEEAADRFAFRHALTREAVLAGLLTWERQTLHRQFADVLAQRSLDGSDRWLDDLAYHAHAAGDWATALDACRRAGKQAQAMGAPRAAAEHFSRAVEAAQRLELPPDLALLRDRGRAYETLGDFARALADHEAALELARASGDRRAEWQALLDLGFLWTGRTYVEAGTYFHRALDLAREIGDPALVARGLNRVGNWHANVEEPFDGQRLHREALAIFEGLGDRQGIAETLDLLGMAAGLAGDLVQAQASYRRAAGLFREFGDRRGLAAVLTALSWRSAAVAMQVVGPAASTTPGEPTPEGVEALKLTREIGWRAGEVYALLWEGLNLTAEGAFAPALAVMHEGLAIAEEIGHRQWTVTGHLGLGTIHDALLAPVAARRHLEHALQLAREIGSLYWFRVVTGVLAAAAARQRDVAGATAVLAALPRSEHAVPTAAERWVWVSEAELALAQGDAAGALETADRLASLAGSSEPPGPIVNWVRGRALAALGHAADAEAALGEARRTAVQYGARPLLWQIDVALGRLYQGEGRRDEAHRAFAAAKATIEELAVDVPDETLRECFLRAAAAYLPAGSRFAPRRPGEPAGDGLTEREREVATLLTQGLSNREIAQALFISEVTVATHVRNMLAKLGFTSRTQIAAWALDRGLKAS